MPEVTLPVTVTFLSVLAISLIPLTGWVGLLRGKINVIRGDGGNGVLFKRIRIHGNLMENAPLFALVLGAAEGAGLAAALCWLAVATFLLGRVLHFMLYDNKMRGGAMFVTLLPGLAMGIWLLIGIWA